MLKVSTKSVCIPSTIVGVHIEYQLLEPFTGKYRYDSCETADNVPCAIEWAKNAVAKSEGLKAIIIADDLYACESHTITVENVA